MYFKGYNNEEDILDIEYYLPYLLTRMYSKRSRNEKLYTKNLKIINSFSKKKFIFELVEVSVFNYNVYKQVKDIQMMLNAFPKEL